jgi:PAS domain-containing protein
MSPDTPTLDDTSERQAALRKYHVLDTAPEKKFDRITSMIAKICDVPTALITLIDEERQWFKSCFGFDQRETDLDVSFCVYAVDAGDMLVVEDATADPRFQDNPIVTGPPHIRFYAGAPLTTPDGVHIGTLCIIDYETRTFDAAQREILEDLADTVVEQFELRSAERQIRQLVAENPQPMYVCTQSDDKILDANLAASELYGYDPAVLSSMTREALLAPPAVQPAREALSMHEDADGTPIPVRVRTEAIMYDGHRATLVVPQPLADDASDTTVFFRADADGTVQSLGPAWTDVTGRPTSVAVGTPLPDLVRPEDRAATETALGALDAAETDVYHHVASFRTDEGRRDLAIRAQRVQAADDAPAGLVGTLTPVSDAVPLPADAPDATDEVPAAPPEPPTPSAPTEEAAPDAGTTASDGTADGDGTAEYDVFTPSLPSFQNPDEAAADAGDSAPPPPASDPDDPAPDEEAPAATPEPFDLTARLHALVDEHTDAPAHDALDIQRSLPDDSCPVRLDRSVVDSIVGALLDNALTHTETGSVTIGLKADEDEVDIEIVDTGTGVEERFMQVYMDAANPSSSSGNLQRVHRLAERIGGSMNMEDAPDGTRFQLTLPRSSTAAPDAPPSSTE